MKRFTLAASLSLAVAVPAAAQASPPTPQHKRAYERAYRQVVHQFGHRAPGRQIIRWGFDAHHKATDAQVVESLGVLGRMLAPPAPAAPAVSTSTSTSASAPVSASTSAGSGSSSGWAIPSSIVNCESGGQNLPPNGAGASGYYQDTPGTWNGYGGYSAAYLAPKSVQDQFNAQLYASQGSGPWTASSSCSGR